MLSRRSSCRGCTAHSDPVYPGYSEHAYPIGDATVVGDAIGGSMSSFASKYGSAHQQTRHTAPVDSRVHTQIARFSKLAFLMNAAQGGLAAIGTCPIPFVDIKTSCQTEIPSQAVVMGARETKACLAPSTRNNRRFNKITMYTVICRWFVVAVEQTNGHQK